MVSKFADHLPLYRIEQIASRSGVSLAQSTLGDWVGRTGFHLTPLWEALKTRLLSQSTIHVDETPVHQLAPGKGKTHKSYLWAYRSNTLDQVPLIIVFDYQTSRHGRHARNFLGEWRGSLCVDDYAGYDKLFKTGTDGAIPCIEVGCMALARSVPLLESLHQFLKNSRTKAADNGASAKAIDYSLKRWEALSRYALTGDLPIDNNPVERGIRPVAIGKKNWLFVGSERSGQRTAILQSLIGTAKLNGIDPYAWLKNTLACLPVWPNQRIDDLLPIHGWELRQIP